MFSGKIILTYLLFLGKDNAALFAKRYKRYKRYTFLSKGTLIFTRDAR